MRARILNKQMVTVRPLAAQDAQVDAFGDAPVVASGGSPRGASFDMPMQIMYGRQVSYGSGVPGRTNETTVDAVVLRRDVPPAGTGWVPQGGDMVVLNDGASLFVDGVEEAFPTRVLSFNRLRGGSDGWRLRLVDRLPEQSAASKYE